MGRDARILITDGLHPEGVRLFEEHAFVPVIKKGLDREAFLRELETGGYVALVLRSATKHLRPGAVDDRLRRALEGVSVVVRQGVGVDNIDIPELSRLGVIVQNTAGSNNESVAQLVFSYIHHRFDAVEVYNRETIRGLWTKGAHTRRELRGTSLGIIGLGHIGLRVAEIAAAWEMRVCGYDLRREACILAHERHGARIADSLEETFECDIVTVHVPGTDKTRGLVTEDLVDRIPAGGLFINTSRAFIADESMLYRLVERRAAEGRPLHLALDVFAEERALSEPRVPESIAEYVCLTPHMGASTPEAQQRGAVMAARQVIDLLERGIVLNALNCPRLEEDSLPYVELADRIATLAAGFFEDLPDKVELTLYGETARFEEGILLGMKAGLVQPKRGALTERIPTADYLLAQRGLVTERRTPDRRKETQPAYERAVTLDFIHETGPLERVSIRGRINYLRKPELQRIDLYDRANRELPAFRSYHLEFPLEGDVVLLEIAEDQKTALGAACTFLGLEKDRDIWRTGQSVHHGDGTRPATALFLLRLDRPLDEEDLAEIRAGAIRVPRRDGAPVPLSVANAFCRRLG